MEELLEKAKHGTDRRRFLKTGLATAGTASATVGLLGRRLPRFGEEQRG
jgi:hypothetical protein